MAKEGWDLILTYGNEAEPQYIRYFSDYWPSFETAGVLIPAKGEPMLLIGPESYTYASDRSVIPDIRLLKAFRESSEPEYPGKKLDTFGALFKEVMGDKPINKFGVAGLPLMTIGVYEALKEALGETKILKADEVVNKIRMNKTENELECMRAAAKITALTFAARRGVDVAVIMPHIPDKKAIFAVSRSYYRQFLEAGIRIYEYTPGFVHAKSLVSDSMRAVVGTINFDYRSLYHHFECGLYLENAPAVEQIEDDFQNTLLKCQRITLSGWKRQQWACRRKSFRNKSGR